jgi:hypothetical protein
LLGNFGENAQLAEGDVQGVIFIDKEKLIQV